MLPAVCGAAAWVEKGREAISACLREATGLTSITWRPAADMLKEEGCGPGGALAAKPPAAAGEAQEGEGEEAGEAEAMAEAGAAAAAEAAAATEAPGSRSGSSSVEARVGAPTVVVTENGIKFEAAPLGQKTGKPPHRLGSAAPAHANAADGDACGTGGACSQNSCSAAASTGLPSPIPPHPPSPAANIDLLPCHPLPRLPRQASMPTSATAAPRCASWQVACGCSTSAATPAGLR